MGTQHVRTRTRKQTPTIRAVDNGPTIFGRLQHLVSERWIESLGKRQHYVWVEPRKDSPGSRRLATAGCAVQENKDERWWRPAQERRTDGSEDFTCAHCVLVEKRARKEPNSFAVAVSSTLCSVANSEDAGRR